MDQLSGGRAQVFCLEAEIGNLEKKARKAFCPTMGFPFDLKAGYAEMSKSSKRDVLTIFEHSVCACGGEAFQKVVEDNLEKTSKMLMDRKHT
ncbi:hypothetical protein CEXT_64321 [Caerostris extrusa]|uniref:Uncharacterized protein n=1 Tax=Caerostris extrusa TaxID=172846 RepID=A0AAV4PLM0_CAEEX|nr:hypothetical protein CEXT_64321 [Caerostris extrusa]